MFRQIADTTLLGLAIIIPISIVVFIIENKFHFKTKLKTIFSHNKGYHFLYICSVPLILILLQYFIIYPFVNIQFPDNYLLVHRICTTITIALGFFLIF